MLDGPYKAIICPLCGEAHDPADYPDHWAEGGRFRFDCRNCGASIALVCEFEPVFYVDKEATKKA